MDASQETALYLAAAALGATAIVVMLNKLLATNPSLPLVPKPFGILKDGVLWNASHVGAPASLESLGGAATVFELMERAFAEFGGAHAAGKRALLKRYYEEIKPGQTVEKLTFADKYSFISYAEYKEQMAALAAGMVAFAKLKPGDKVVIYAETQLEWMLAALASFSQSLTVVTVYATLGEEGLAHGLTQTKAKLIVADAKLLPKVANAVASASKEMASCKHVLYISDPVQEHDEKAASALKKTLTDLKNIGWNAQELKDAMDAGRAQPRQPTPPAPEDVAVIMYTSGTTGMPKGVVISHSNIVHAVVGCKDCLLTYLPDGKMAGHVFQAYLPLAHIMEMVLEIACLSHGVICGYGNPHTLTPAGVKLKTGTCQGDAATLRPTLMVFAPAILDKVQVALNAKISASSPIVQTLFKWGLAAGESNFAKGIVGAPWYYNKIVFKKVQALLGGRVIFAATGSAPLAPQTQRFVQTAFNAPTRQGYGLTETCATSCIQVGCDNSSGVVGPPTSTVAIKLLDWAEGNYLNADEHDPAIGMRRGEVLIGGPTVCMGYLVDPNKPDPDVVKKNKEDFSVDENGMRWFHTGDIGQINKNGCLQIIDRKKDLVKLQQGEYVALSKVESALKACPLVEIPLCYGRSSESYCVALVCPVHAQLKALGDELGLSGKSIEELCVDAKVVAEVTKRCQAACKGKLVNFEIPKKIALVADPWTPENDLLTAAMKLKRVPICKKHAAELDALYKTWGTCQNPCEVSTPDMHPMWHYRCMQ